MSEALRARAAALSVADLVDAVDRARVATALTRVAGRGTMAGWARTARAVPGDAAAVHAAVRACGPGEVVVVDYGGPETVSGIGSLVAAEARRRGAAGIVLWGSCRDAGELRELGLPIFATGTHPIAGVHADPGEQDAALAFAGVEVAPGELVVGDDDGLAVFAAAEVAALVAAAERAAALDAELAAGVAGGTSLWDLPQLTDYIAAVDEPAARGAR